MRRSFCILLGLAALPLGLYVTAAWAQSGPADKILDKIVAQDADFIKTTLGKANLEKDKKSQQRMRMAAMLIAQSAQSAIDKNNPKNAALASLRDRALAVRKAIEDGKFADAKTLTEKLALSAPVDMAAKLTPPALEKLEDFGSVMRVFSSVRVGGFAMEDYLDELSMLKANPSDADAVKIEVFAGKLAAIGTLSQAHTPENLGGARTLERWKGFGKDMHKDSLDLLQAAGTRKAAAISKAAIKAADTCKSCHDVFR